MVLDRISCSWTVVCSNCGTGNREGRKFCANCGQALALACPACGAANELGERFCGECGAALTAMRVPASEPALRELPTSERRLISVLFADLGGFTSLSEARTPEDARELLSRYSELARTLVKR